MAKVSETVSKAFNAENINYELLVMGDAHLHWYIIPRKYGDLGGYGNKGRGPVWCYTMEECIAITRPFEEQLR